MQIACPILANASLEDAQFILLEDVNIVQIACPILANTSLEDAQFILLEDVG